MTNTKHIATLCRRGYPTAHIYFFYDQNRDDVIIIDTYKWCVRRNFDWSYELPCYLKGEYGTIDIGYLTPDYETEED